MTERRVIGFTVAEALKLGHLHDVAVDTVKGAIAAVPNGDVRIGEKRLGSIEPLDFVVERRHGCIKMPGQSVDLLGVKDRVALHKRNFDFDVGAGVVGVGPDDLVGVDDEGSFLALAHLSAELGGLLVGQPERAAVVFLHGSGPQHQDIDAAVGLAAGAQRPRYRPGLVAGLPWLQPGEISTLEIGEDLVGDAGVNVGFLGHCRSPFWRR
jgi:hypothetical protein